jgi:hypothetical protein
VGRFFAPSWRYLKCKTIGSGCEGITWKRRAKRSPQDFKRPWSDGADAFMEQAMNRDGHGAVDGD